MQQKGAYIEPSYPAIPDLTRPEACSAKSTPAVRGLLWSLVEGMETYHEKQNYR